ncbi:NDP-sugar synthase [Methanobacterium ferruginis]|uniref:NDP-sugar synthase n=1 Tax=Methanobacterium ferruginis TaxID=710191 RepID=UPI002573CC33|nr:NDP-sugar synthase [Methanobacterium ferruginis]BDZ66583.1 mannose-1-phosphate guanylyltransferase [Methanobacterium ferruginis]BDZ69481.1 mannose-1-phosphate guanylyltransferase [Methanobacterium ferruginis]
MVKAVLMAGGKGSRIRPLTLSRPKPMIPVANRPMIEYIVEKIKNSGYNELVVTLSYLKNQLKHLLNERYPELNIKYSVEKQPFGTAGGVKKAEKYLDDTFFVLSGDVLVDVDLNKLLDFHRKHNALATMVLTPVEDPSHFGIAVLDENKQIIKFLEKPAPHEVFSKIANTGTYILEPEIFNYIENRKGEVDFSHDVFPRLIEEKAGIYGYVLDGYWNDVGRPKTYLQANYDVLNKKMTPNPPGKKLKESIGRLGDIWVGKDVEIDEKVRIVGPVAIGDGSVIERGCTIGRNTVIGENAYLEKNSTIKGSVIFPESMIKASACLKDCIVDSGCCVEKGSFIERGAILGSSVQLGPFSRVKSGRSIYNSVVILPDSIVDSDYPIVT